MMAQSVADLLGPPPDDTQPQPTVTDLLGERPGPVEATLGAAFAPLIHPFSREKQGVAQQDFLDNTAVGRVLAAIGHGIKEGWGSDSLGLSPETDTALQKAGIFRNQEAPHSFADTAIFDPIRAFNEGIIRPAAVAMDTALRAGGSVLGAYQGGMAQAGKETEGVPLIDNGRGNLFKELAAIPEAFYGQPFGLGVPHPPEAIAARLNAAAEVMRGDDAAFMGMKPAPDTPPPLTPDFVASVAPRPEPPTPAPADVHALARQINPDVFAKYDPLVERQTELRGLMDRLSAQRDQDAAAPFDAKMAEIQGQLSDLTEQGGYFAKRQKLQAQLEDMTRQREDAITAARQAGDTDPMARLRQTLQGADYQMRDLAPEVSAAYREAQARMPEPPAIETAADAAPASAQQVPEAAETLASAAPKAPVPAADQVPTTQEAAASGEAATPPTPAVTTPDHLQAIRDDVAKQVSAARPELAAHADAYGQLVAAHYDTLAKLFGGSKGTALDLYRAESADVRAGKQRAVEFAQKDGRELNQYAQFKPVDTASQEFKQWFGDSKTVDADGKPLVVYHGTNDDIADFRHGMPNKRDGGWLGRGFYFITDPKTASDYTMLKPGDSGNVIPAYVSIKNPYMATLPDKERLMLAEKRGEKWAAQEWTDELKSQGYDGVILDYSRSLEGYHVKEVVAFDPSQIKSASSNTGEFSREDHRILFQPRRGSLRLLEGRKPILTLFKDADASTFLHETGHQWLEELNRLSADDAAPAQMKADMATVRDWLGVKEGETIPRKAHEKWARGFERYLMEGVAPSKDLAGVFAKFKQWLTAIYRKVEALKSPITDDIRDVMDRLISANPERQPVIAAERESPRTMADIHEADVESAPSPAHDPAAVARIADTIADERRAAIERDIPHHADAILAGTGGEPGGRPAAGAEPHGAELKPEPAAGGDGGAVATGEVGTGGSETASGSGGPSEEQRPTPDQRFAPAADALVDKAGNIRLDNMAAPEDIKRALREIANRNEGFIGERGGVISDDAVMRMADASGLTFSQIRDFAQTMRMGPVVIKAAEKMLIEASGEARGLARTFLETGAEADRMKAAEAWSRMEMIQGTFSRLTSDPGRMLRALTKSDEWRKLGMSAEAGLETATGRTPQQWTELFQAVAAQTDPAGVAKVIADASKPTLRDKIQFVALNGLISGPVTHMTYEAAAYLAALEEALVERPIAAALGTVREVVKGEPVPGRVQWREVTAALYGVGKGSRDGVRAALEAWKTNVTTPLPGEAGSATPLFEGATPKTVRAAPIGGPVGAVIGAPGRVVTAMHSFNRQVYYAMDVHAHAVRAAMEEGLTGNDRDLRVAQLTKDPTPEMMAHAIDYATKLAYMQKPKYGTFMWHIEHAANSSLAAKMVLPFTRIAGNIINRAYVERTPLGVMNSEIRDALLGKEGTTIEQRDFARARMIAGSLIGMTVAGMVLDGTATGPGPADAKKRALWMIDHQPYSLRIGGVWVPYKRLGHIGMLMGMGAGIADTIHVARTEEADKAAFQLVHEIANNVVDESWMAGLSHVLKIVESPEQSWKSVGSSMASEFVPYSAMLRQSAHAFDSQEREAKGIGDKMQAMVPFWRESLYPRRDIWGEAVPARDSFPMGLARGAAAVVGAQEGRQPDPLTEELERIGYFPAPPLRRIRGVQLTPEQYDDYSRVAGRYARMMVTQMATQPGWGTLPDGVRRESVHQAFEKARNAASRMVMMQSYGKDNDIVTQAQNNKRKALQ